MDGQWNPGTPPRRYRSRHALRAKGSGFNPWVGLGGIAATSGIAMSLIVASSPVEPNTAPADAAADVAPQQEEEEGGGDGGPSPESTHEWEMGPMEEESDTTDKPAPAPEPEPKSSSEDEDADEGADEGGEGEEDEESACVGDTHEVTSDAFVRDGAQSSTNYGDDRLEVKHDAAEGASRISYLKFDVAQLRECDEVESVKLNVMGYVSDSSGDTTDIGVHASGADWEEDAITWDNRPELDGAIHDFTVSGTSGDWYTVDVTDYVLGSDADEMSLALHSPNDGSENLATILGDRHSGQGASLVTE